MPTLRNARHELFAQEMAKGKSAVDAYELAGYKADRGAASRLAAKDTIQQRVAELKNRAAERAQIDIMRTLQELVRLGTSDLRSAFDENGNLKRPAEWDDDFAAAVASIEVVTRNIGDGEVEHVHKVKLWDKNSALEKIAKHLGMFIERHEHTGKGGGAIAVEMTDKDRAKALASLMGKLRGG